MINFNNTSPLVSIMIPNYNQEEYIERAIKSALAQDYPNIEVIIADDCSTDNTFDLVKKFLDDPRIKYFKNEVNLGRVGNYRKSLKEYASGEWAVNLDGDDFYIDNHFVSEVLEIIESDKSQHVVFVQGGKVRRKGNKRIFDLPSIDEKVKFLNGRDYFLNFPNDTHFSHMSTIYNRKKALEIGFYEFDITSSDLESFLRLALHGDVVLIKKAFGEWTQHNNNFSSNLSPVIKKNNLKFINSSYNYALKMGLEPQILNSWKKKVTINYIKSWASKILKGDQKVANFGTFIKYVWSEHKYFFWDIGVIKQILLRPISKKY